MEQLYRVSFVTRAAMAVVLLAVSLLTCASASSASNELKLRERVMQLEDERDLLQSKYESIAAEYKTVKGEIRSSIDLQKRLDDALAVAAELQERSGDVSGLARGLEKCEFARENVLVDLMLTESSLNEMIRKYRDLERQMHKEDCSAIKADLVEYRNQAEQCMTDVDGLKKANNELSKRTNEQAAKLAGLEDVEGKLIKTAAELEVVTARNDKLVGDSMKLEELEKAHVALRAQMANKDSMLVASKNELAATKAALNGLLDSLDSRLQFEALKDAHEKEILPYWLQSLVTRALQHAGALYAIHVQPIYLASVEYIDNTRMHAMEQINSLRRTTSDTLQTILHPMAIKADVVFGKDVPVRKQLDRVAEFWRSHLATLHLQGAKLRLSAGRFQRASVRIIAAKVSVVLSKMSFVDNTRERVNTELLASGIFYTLVGACTLPLVAIAINSIFNGLLYYFRTGTALIVVTNESETIDMIEESIGYKFRNRDYAVQALEKSQSLHQVGLAIINLILANEIKGTDSRKEIEQRSLHSCVDRIVRPGPGRKSIHVAKEDKAYMYICLLAAVFRDSDESVEKVMRVWGITGENPTHLEATNDKYIPVIEDDDDDEMPDILHSGRSSSSSVSVGEAGVMEEEDFNEEKGSAASDADVHPAVKEEDRRDVAPVAGETDDEKKRNGKSAAKGKKGNK